MDSNIAVLRHVIATLAYRAAKTFRDAPGNFGAFHMGGKSKTPIEIVSHMGDLIDWTLSMASGKGNWCESVPKDWLSEVNRFHESLSQLDNYLAGGAVVSCSIERLLQGPIADAMTHIGQLAMMRRMAGAPIIGENYFVADIVVGRVGLDQAQPRKVFDKQ